MNGTYLSGLHLARALAIAGAIAVIALSSYVTSAAAASSPEPAATASASPCATSGLVIWITFEGVGAGTSYYHLEFTNLSGHTCTLRGYPKVSAVDLSGHEIGQSAARDASTNAPKAVTISLGSGGTATALLAIVNALNYVRPACHSETSAGLRVELPSQMASKVVPFPFRACSGDGPDVLGIQAIQKTLLGVV